MKEEQSYKEVRSLSVFFASVSVDDEATAVWRRNRVVGPKTRKGARTGKFYLGMTMM